MEQSQYKKNKERFPKDQCQSCGTGLHEDDGKVCDTCKKEMREQGIYLQEWLEEYDTTRNPAYDGAMGIFEGMGE